MGLDSEGKGYLSVFKDRFGEPIRSVMMKNTREFSGNHVNVVWEYSFGIIDYMVLQTGRLHAKGTYLH